MPLELTLNGQPRTFENVAAPTPLDRLIAEMDLKADRIAVEHNGEIAARGSWPEIWVNSGDRLEIVHFVGGGALEEELASTRRPQLEGRGRSEGRTKQS